MDGVGDMYQGGESWSADILMVPCYQFQFLKLCDSMRGVGYCTPLSRVAQDDDDTRESI